MGEGTRPLDRVLAHDADDDNLHELAKSGHWPTHSKLVSDGHTETAITESREHPIMTTTLREKLVTRLSETDDEKL